MPEDDTEHQDQKSWQFRDDFELRSALIGLAVGAGVVGVLTFEGWSHRIPGFFDLVGYLICLAAPFVVMGWLESQTEIVRRLPKSLASLVGWLLIAAAAFAISNRLESGSWDLVGSVVDAGTFFLIISAGLVGLLIVAVVTIVLAGLVYGWRAPLEWWQRRRLKRRGS